MLWGLNRPLELFKPVALPSTGCKQASSHGVGVILMKELPFLTETVLRMVHALHQLLMSGRVGSISGLVVPNGEVGGSIKSLLADHLGDILPLLLVGQGRGDGDRPVDVGGLLDTIVRSTVVVWQKNGELARWVREVRRRGWVNRLRLIKSGNVAGHLGKTVQDGVFEEFRVVVWRRARLSRC